ncbi:multi-sensor signal transduction histidine kinase [Salegentibacter echinorum]|uniref:histidine kinase n=1 Tax=Salegentibacter echinorum TaxID=1073325 RepID=A0A1M5FMB1_SALEC|nr:ATP-binding protein [Salegentibacter echinorum]SHF92302.1 multi-sensor signal transduction histidine kinase [Salegentibacter echinorum]
MLDNTYYPDKVDISNCEKEPIHLIGKAQAHGVILAVDPTSLKILQASENTANFLGIAHSELLNKDISLVVGEKYRANLAEANNTDEVFKASEIEINNHRFVLLPHKAKDTLIIDFEVLGKDRDSLFFQQQLTSIITGLDSVTNIQNLCREAVKLTRDIFGYDRVMIYRFDEEWNGEVFAEEKKQSLESWLGLHYPASDIPSQSRNLFLEHKVRIISNVNYTPVPITPQLSPTTNKPLDLSRSELRGVSPIHIEYLQNMGVGASLTVALIANGKLWGLLACHHYSAKFINYYQRETCKFLGQVFSNKLALLETRNFNNKLRESEILRDKIREKFTSENTLFSALTSGKTRFVDLIDCGGGALFYENKLTLTGKTPAEADVHKILDFVANKQKTLFFSKSLKKQFPEAEKFKKTASGILAMNIGRGKTNFIIWFRPAVSETVNWGGNPNKKVFYNQEKQRLSPRKSFQKWSEKLDGVASTWQDYELETAKAFSENINQFILQQQKDEISRLNANLITANKDLELFSYGISHDLKSPLRAVKGYAQMLQEDFTEEIPAGAVNLIQTIYTSGEKMELLIEHMLDFAKITGGELQKRNLDLESLLKEIITDFNIENNYPKTVIDIESNLPAMFGDRDMLYQVWLNLLENALKYSQKSEKPNILIGVVSNQKVQQKNRKPIYYIKDNGIGVSEESSQEVFQLFRRFSPGEYKGTGIGLALVKRVIEKHAGEIWVESNLGKGSTFFFHL